ncbi:hypothetical protein [Nostoc sp. FACHB-133]|uniref:hypothetical protein n=1 Tax=Nostoc sp. FACHB-133 TaxID=2692835 RepID=UPI00168624A4|nr:hypothetical protein [Nostoc sp. FACHB-133]MBD2527957.1 hypothetical protein [Nostoc sp. FACHB-133]
MVKRSQDRGRLRHCTESSARLLTSVVWWTGLATALPIAPVVMLYYFLLASSQLTRHRRRSLREQALHP